MSTETNPISDLELVRYLDGELEAKERSALDSRLAAAPEAAARLEQLRRRSRNMSALLRSNDAHAAGTRASAEAIRPRMNQQSVRFGWPPYLKAAAVVALLLTGALAVPPARAWLLARLLDAGAALGLRPTETSAPEIEQTPAPAQGASLTEVVYSFQVTSDTFDVEVMQTAGRLVVERSDDGSASASAAGAGDESFLVLPRGIRIEGPATTGTLYTISLPDRVAVVRIQQRSGVSLHSLRRDQPLEIDLGSR